MNQPGASDNAGFLRSTFFLVITLTVGSAAFSADWPQFRGRGNGVSKDSTHSVTWAEDSNVAWKIPVEGVGWSQPIIHSQRIYLTTAVTENQPKPKAGESGPGFNLFSTEGFSRSFLGGGSPPDVEYTWKLICLDLKTGERIWEKVVRKGKPTIPTHRSNSYASETPICDGFQIYVYVAMAGLYCFDMEGNEVWNKPFEAKSIQYGWGTGSSPMLFCTTIYIQCDNEDESFLVALNRKDGSERWRVKRDELSNWSTPYLWQLGSKRELVTCGGNKVRAYNNATGELLWELKSGGRCATSAVGDYHTLYVGSVSRLTGASGTLTAIKSEAEGELSLDRDNPSPHIAWSVKSAAPEIASPLLYRKQLYTLSQSGGIISCLDANTGKRLYRERFPGAAGFTASPWAAGDHIFCLDENGKTFVVAAKPEFELVETNQLDGMFWSSAAVADDAVLLRSTESLYRISRAQQSRSGEEAEAAQE